MLQKQHSTFKNWEDFKKMTPKEPVLMRQQRDQKEPGKSTSYELWLCGILSPGDDGCRLRVNRLYPAAGRNNGKGRKNCIPGERTE